MNIYQHRTGVKLNQSMLRVEI